MTSALSFGYWLPVFGGWLRNIEDEGMVASWDYAKRLVQRSEQLGYDLTLIAELNLNDIKGVDAPTLDAWSTTAALAAVTERLVLMTAVRPNFHHPGLFAKAAANIDQIASGRLALNVVSSWWQLEAKQYGLPFDEHQDRYRRTSEWIHAVKGLWTEPRFTHQGDYYQFDAAICSPKPPKHPHIYAGGESEAAKNMIAASCDAYVMHGDAPEMLAAKIRDMRERRARLAPAAAPLRFGLSGFAICRPTEAAAKAELNRMTDVRASASGYANFSQWLAGTQLETQMSLEEYSVSNRGLRTGLVGTPAQLADRLGAFATAGVDLMLLQFSPQAEEMERFSTEVMRFFRS